MTLTELSLRFEKLSGQIADEYYKQYAGLTYDRDLMKKLAQQLTKVSEEFLEEFTDPRRMYLASIETIAEAERLEVELDFHDQRMEKISSVKHRIKGEKVNWGSWRQFNSQTDNPQIRKEVFDEFLEKTPKITYLVEKRMKTSEEVYKRYKLTPLESYLELEQISYADLENLLIKLGDGAKQAFLSAADHYAPQILNKTKAEYYDDFYTWRGRIFKPLNKYLEGKDPLYEAQKFLGTLSFDTSAIDVDAEDRPNKSPSASCWGIQIPNDVRILYRDVSPFTNMRSVFHEFGHGIHGISANPDDSVWKRYIVPMSVAETFSILIENITENPIFLREDLRLEEEAVKEIADRVRFMSLTFMTFYAANSIMKMEFWKNSYTIEEAASRWEELTDRFFIRTPGSYWVLHHVMPNFDLYSPSYVIASVRVATLRETLIQDYGARWWRNPKAGELIMHLAQTRGEFEIKKWKLNPEIFLREQKALSFL